MAALITSWLETTSGLLIHRKHCQLLGVMRHARLRLLCISDVGRISRAFIIAENETRVFRSDFSVYGLSLT